MQPLRTANANTGNAGPSAPAATNRNNAQADGAQSDQDTTSVPERRLTQAAAARAKSAAAAGSTNGSIPQHTGSSARGARQSSRIRRGTRGSPDYGATGGSDDSAPQNSHNIRPDEREYLAEDGGRVERKSALDLKNGRSINVNKWLKIKSVRGKGRGVYTRRAVPAGFLLLQEPVLVAKIKPRETREKKETYQARLRARIHRLSHEDRLKFLTLCFKDGQDTEEARVDSNAFSIAEGSAGNREIYHHVWFYISMLNHSCIPNAALQYRSVDNLGYNVRARVTIPANTEVTINYKPEWEDGEGLPEGQKPEKLMTVARRKKCIKDHWGFTCGCAAWMDGKATNADNRRLEKLRDTLRTADYDLASPKDRDKYCAKMAEYIALLKKYNLVSSIQKAAREAIEFMEQAIDEEDIAQGFTVEWQREALAAATATLGLESLADPVPQLGEGFVGTGRDTVEHLLDIAQSIPANMQRSFKDPVIPLSDDEDDFGDEDSGGKEEEEEDLEDDAGGSTGRENGRSAASKAQGGTKAKKSTGAAKKTKPPPKTTKKTGTQAGGTKRPRESNYQGLQEPDEEVEELPLAKRTRRAKAAARAR